MEITPYRKDNADMISIVQSDRYVMRVVAIKMKFNVSFIVSHFLFAIRNCFQKAKF